MLISKSKLGFTALLTLFLLSVQISVAQIYDPVKWSFHSKAISDQEYEIQFKALIEPGWHLYSQNIPENGPIPTEFIFNENENVDLSATTSEPKGIKKHDPQFDMLLTYFEDEATFTKNVKITGSSVNLTGELTFMVCNEKMCLPPEYIEFAFDLGGDKTSTDDTEEAETTEYTDAHGAGEIPEGVTEIHNPVSWKYGMNKLEDGVYELTVMAEIEEGWHLYSQELASDDGPVATEFRFTESEAFEVVGKVDEQGELHEEYDPNFMMDLTYFENKVTFVQKVKLAAGDTRIEGDVYFMVCNAEMCLPPETVEFVFDTEKGVGMDKLDLETTDGSDAGVNKTKYKIANVDLKNPLNQCGEPVETEDSQSLWTVFILGFLGGLVALLTPCVFPMIPLTVSFFTKGSENKRKGIMNALTYGFFIFFIYILISLPFHIFDSIAPNILNVIATHWVLNVFFFVIFVVFAISFFGYFEITLPSKFTNKVDSASDVGGLIGIFFMALTLAIVSFSCTGPILGTLLASSFANDGGATPLTVGMGGFGLALALPFGLFAAFPGWLNSLPKSGGWLNSVKVVLGFVEIALAIKFLSNADLVNHWLIIPFEVFIGAWIIIGIGLFLYLLGKIKFPHDSPVSKLGATRLSLAAIVLAFTVYLGSGFRYNEDTETFTPLSLLSGLPPPVGYSWIFPNHCPQNLNCFHDYNEGMAYARQTGKPVMLDFTGWACVNCREMEENVWDKEEVFNRLNDDYVLISLYVDDKEELPEEEKGVYTNINGKKRKIRTVGDKWSTMQSETFINNSQPYYVLLSNDEQLLTKPVGNTPDVDEYLAFLNCGLEANKKLTQTAAVKSK